jgi:hypothetical protein
MPSAPARGQFRDSSWHKTLGNRQLEGWQEQLLTQLDKGPMKDRPLEGYIGFQDHGQPNNIKFRDIRIREIKP